MSQREQFQMEKPITVNLRNYRVRSQGRCPPFINLLVIGSSIGLFAYVNTYFIISIADVIDGSVFNKTTQTFSCDSYFCDQTAYNFVYFYSYFKKCNFDNCEATICSNYDCTDINNNYGDLNRYYACQPTCPGFTNSDPPGPVNTAYVMAIVTACFFGVGILLNILYGVIVNFCSQGLSCLERIGLLLGFVWPKLKYYAFRKREYWDDFNFNFKTLIGIQIAVNVCYAVTLALYIYMEIQGFWQTPAEIANFYMLIWAYVVRISLVGEVAGPFCRADSELFELRNASSFI